MEQPENQETKYHHLVAGQIMLTVEGEDSGMNTAFLNGVITTKEPLVGAHDIGRAQQTLQMLFFKKVPPTDHQKIKIVDVVITGLFSLGYMTDERFLKKPEGVEVRERARAALSLVADNKMPADPEAGALH